MNSLPFGHVSKSVVPFVLGLFFFVYSVRMPFGTWNNPGAGLWPTCLSALIIVTSVVLFFTNKKSEDDEAFTRDSRYTLYGIVSLAVFIVLFERIGLSVPSLLVFLFWIRYMGKERWTTSVLVSIGLTAVIYSVFSFGLDIPFPEDKLLVYLDRGTSWIH